MTTWSSFEKDKLLVEGWRSFLNEEQQVVFGLNSKDNKDSLINILNKLAGFLNPEQKIAIINLIADAASDEDIMLEAATLQGAKSEKDRVFSAETVKEILQGIVKLNLDTQKTKAVIKALNYWGRVNTINFEKPAAAAQDAPVEVPDEEGETIEPESSATPRKGEQIIMPDGTLAYVDDDDDDEFTALPPPLNPSGPETEEEIEDLQAQEQVAKQKAKEIKKQDPQDFKQKKDELDQQVEILRQTDEPDKGFLGLLRNNPFSFMFSIPSNIVDGIITVYNLESEQRTKSNLSKVVIQEVFDIGDSIAYDLLPDNTPHLLKERKFKELFTGVLTNITTKGQKALAAAVKLCKLCKGVLAGKAIISKIPKVGGLVVALAQAIAVIACPIAKMAPKLGPLMKGDASSFSENPFFTAGLSGKGATKDNNNKLVINDRTTYKREGVPDVLEKIKATQFENKQDAEMYALGLQSYASILGGFEKIDTSGIFADEPEEAETEPITPAEPVALQESKQVIRWKQLAGIS